jgi:hypothetical protein
MVLKKVAQIFDMYRASYVMSRAMTFYLISTDKL